MKILNLYAGIGGNRKLWTPNGDEHEITAVEIDQQIAKIYSDFFPNDTVIVADAHQYLLDHYSEFDFIWSSPPCPTHSRARFAGYGSGKMDPMYPNMKLYQEILWLDNYYEGKWIVENVKPFYKELMPGKKRGRHLYWSNFNIGTFDSKDADINRGNINELQKLHGFDISKYNISQRRDKILRNCVSPDAGLYILNCVMKIITKQSQEQLNIFESN